MYLSDLPGEPRCRIFQGISVPEETKDTIQYFCNIDAIFTENLQRPICPNTVGLQQKRGFCGLLSLTLVSFQVAICLKIYSFISFPRHVTPASLSVFFLLLLEAVSQQNNPRHSAFPSALQFLWLFVFVSDGLCICFR